MSIVLFNRTLEQRVRSILRRTGGSLYVPSPANCFQDSAGTTPCAVDDPVGYLKDMIGTNHATQATAGFKPILRGKVKNLLLNSATLSTQNITSVAVPYTLSFENTGTVTLSGTSTAGPLVGTGVGNRVSLTFTPTAGTLTLTVSGTVSNAQLEIGSTANQYTPTTSVPASSPYGPYWLDFDGADDILVTPSFNMNGLPVALLSTFRHLGGGTDYGAVITVGNAVHFMSIGRSSVSTDSYARLDTSNTIGNGFNQTMSNGAAFDGFTHIVRFVKSNVRKTWFDGNLINSLPITNNVNFDQASNLSLGSGFAKEASRKSNIALYSSIFLQGTFTEKELIKIEKYLAKKAEISL
jgi:hypothetical protein